MQTTGPWQRMSGLVLVASGLLASSVGAEEVSMTAYYPSPRGMYEELRTSNDTYLATAGGRVGIGTDTPQGLLELENTNGDVNVYFTSHTDVPGHARLNLRRARLGPAAVQANDELGVLRFEGYDGTDYDIAARIRGEADGSPVGGNVPGRMLFFTQTPGAGYGGIERMRIDSQGHVGVGITNPLNTLHVKGGVGLESAAPGGSWNLAINGAGDLSINANTAGPGGNSRMILKDSGEVGIGTAAPAQQLHVNGLIRGQLECRTVTHSGPPPTYDSLATCAADEWLLSGGGFCANGGAGTELGFLHSNYPAGNTWVVDCWDPVNDVPPATPGLGHDTPSTAFAICCKRGN